MSDDEMRARVLKFPAQIVPGNDGLSLLSLLIAVVISLYAFYCILLVTILPVTDGIFVAEKVPEYQQAHSLAYQSSVVLPLGTVDLFENPYP